MYESYAAGSFGADQTVASDDPGEVTEQLAATMREIGANALNLRVHLPGMSPEQVREQIGRIGSTVVLPLQRILSVEGWATPPSADRRPPA